MSNDGGSILTANIFTPTLPDQTFSADKKNLTFRVTTLGQQGISPNYNAATNGPDGANYRASYSVECVLLHGGEGWVTGDQITVKPEYADEAADIVVTGSGNNKSTTGKQATVTIEVMDHETTEV